MSVSFFFFDNKLIYINSMKLRVLLQLACVQKAVQPKAGTDDGDANKSI